MPSLDKASLLPQPPTLDCIIPPLALLGVLSGVIVLLHYQTDGLSLAPCTRQTLDGERKRLRGPADRKANEIKGMGRLLYFPQEVLCAMHLVALQLWFQRKFSGPRRLRLGWKVVGVSPLQLPEPRSSPVPTAALTAPARGPRRPSGALELSTGSWAGLPHALEKS